MQDIGIIIMKRIKRKNIEPQKNYIKAPGINYGSPCGVLAAGVCKKVEEKEKEKWG